MTPSENTDKLSFYDIDLGFSIKKGNVKASVHSYAIRIKPEYIADFLPVCEGMIGYEFLHSA
jgi:hypothetical protein